MAIKQDNNRNEPTPTIGEGNRLVKSELVDVRERGLAGRRVLLDRTLRAVDGFGAAQFDAAGISVREIVEERETVNYLLERVIRYDGRRTSRQRQRSAALRLAGHLLATEMLDVIVEVARSPEEPVTVRAAAFDALGMLGDDKAADVVAEYIDAEDERIASRALWAIGRVGGREHLADLERRLERAKPDARGEAIRGAVGSLGVRLGIPVAIPEVDRRRPRRRRTSVVDAD